MLTTFTLLHQITQVYSSKTELVPHNPGLILRKEEDLKGNVESMEEIEEAN